MSIERSVFFHSKDSKNIEDKALTLMLKEVCHDT